MTSTKTYPAGAKVRLADIARGPDGTPGLLPISARTWLNWVEKGIAPAGELLGPRCRVWTVEQVLAVGAQQIEPEAA
jgi:hypothetical protein